MKQPALGQKILELRQQKGFTQEELVVKCNISVRTIQRRIEAGETMPRVYTIKTILSALDRDLDDLQDTAFETTVKNALLIEIDDTKDVSFIINQLHIGWIAGVLSMIAFIMEFIDDFYFVTQQGFYFGKLFTIILSITSITLFALFMRSFVLLGNLLKNSFLKIVSAVFIAAHSLLAVYALFDLEFNILPFEAYAVMYTVFYGIMSLFFGYALYKLQIIKSLSKVSGIIQMVLGGMMVSIFLGIIAGPLSILAQGINVILILKTIDLYQFDFKMSY